MIPFHPNELAPRFAGAFAALFQDTREIKKVSHTDIEPAIRAAAGMEDDSEWDVRVFQREEGTDSSFIILVGRHSVNQHQIFEIYVGSEFEFEHRMIKESTIEKRA